MSQLIINDAEVNQVFMCSSPKQIRWMYSVYQTSLGVTCLMSSRTVERPFFAMLYPFCSVLVSPRYEI